MTHETTMSWSQSLAALDTARRNVRLHEFNLEARLAEIEAEIQERQAFARHLVLKDQEAKQLLRERFNYLESK